MASLTRFPTPESFLDDDVGSEGTAERDLGSVKARTIRGTSILRLPVKKVDSKPGSLSYSDFNELPFTPARNFVVSVPEAGTKRGGHAHFQTKMLLQCVSGSILVSVDNGHEQSAILLEPNGRALVVEELVWSTQMYLSPGSVLVALCSMPHDPADYVDDFEIFVALTKRHRDVVESPTLETPVKVGFLDIRSANLMVGAQLRESFDRVLYSGRYVLSDEVTLFEERWAAFCGARYCVGVGSGLAALHLILIASDIGVGDEVLVASNTYIATVLAVSQAGATPVFVEPDQRTRNIDPARIEAAITPRTKAILSVDLYGNPVDYAALASIAQRHGFLFFSDAAQSHGAKRDGHVVGSAALGCHATAFSFYPSKNLGAIGEAGAVVTDDVALADRIRALRNYGSRARYHNDEKGVNERMDVLQAAFLTAKLPHLMELNKRRTKTAESYLQGLADLDWLELPAVEENVEPSWHLFVVSCVDRDGLQRHLASLQIDSMVHYPIPPHLSEAYSDMKLGKGSLPIAEKLADSVLSIPICPFLRDDQVEAVIRGVRSFQK
jgi:dTDP-4-amino-4,6-dideoxygalactose transaminase